MLLLARRVRSEEVKYIWPGLSVPPPILIPFERSVFAKSDSSASTLDENRARAAPMTNDWRSFQD